MGPILIFHMELLHELHGLSIGKLWLTLTGKLGCVLSKGKLGGLNLKALTIVVMSSPSIARVYPCLHLPHEKDEHWREIIGLAWKLTWQEEYFSGDFRDVIMVMVI